MTMKLNLMMTTLLVAAGVAAAETKVTFDLSTDLPKGWPTGITGQGQAKWEVVADDSAPSKPNVLKQSGEATFAWAAKTDEKIKDGVAEVKFKAVSGKEDQAGGIVFRFQDDNIHHHMTHEKPRYIFLHYWGKGRTESLAQSFKKALDVQKTVN